MGANERDVVVVSETLLTDGATEVDMMALGTETAIVATWVVIASMETSMGLAYGCPAWATVVAKIGFAVVDAPDVNEMDLNEGVEATAT